MLDRLIRKLMRNVFTLFNSGSDYAELLRLYQLEMAENQKLKERLEYVQSLLTAAAGIDGVNIKTDSLMASIKAKLN